eukprot:Nk52_evm87s2367 gene=Nk52_evmTU87s2367
MPSHVHKLPIFHHSSSSSSSSSSPRRKYLLLVTLFTLLLSLWAFYSLNFLQSLLTTISPVNSPARLRAERFVSRWRPPVHPVQELPTTPIRPEDYPTREENEAFWNAAKEIDCPAHIVGFPQDIEHYSPYVRTADNKRGGEGRQETKVFGVQNMWVRDKKDIPEERVTVENILPIQDVQRGVVSCVGGKDFFMTYIPILIYQKSVLGSKLPFHIFYVGEDELPQPMRELLEDISKRYGGGEVTMSDISTMVEGHGVEELRSYRVKGFAMMLSPFKETIYMDADMWAIFRPLDVLFEDKDYKRTGAGFFHDRYFHMLGRAEWQGFWTWSFIGNKCEGDVEFCTYNSQMLRGMSAHDGHSALMVLDTDWSKTSTRDYFTYLLLLNHHQSYLHHIAYGWTWGDKETFWLSRERAGQKYKFFDKVVAYIGKPREMANVNESCLAEVQMMSKYQGDPIGINVKADIFESNVENYSHWADLAPIPYMFRETFTDSKCTNEGAHELEQKWIRHIFAARDVLNQYRKKVEEIFPDKEEEKEQ